MQGYKTQAKPGKIFFCRESKNLAGTYCCKEGFTIELIKINAIVKMARPKNVNQVEICLQSQTKHPIYEVKQLHLELAPFMQTPTIWLTALRRRRVHAEGKA